MNESDFLKLQNGSDIRGVACEGVPGESVTLSALHVKAIGFALVRYVASSADKAPEKLRIACGRDSRITGEALLQAFSEGVRATGADVIDCGITSTPAMFMSCVYDELQADAACMLTASHLPFNRNGCKFFTRDGGFDKEDITAVLRDAASVDVTSLSPEASASYGGMSVFDLTSLYAGKLCDIIRKEANASDYAHPLKGLKIVVDAGNGAGGFFATKVLDPLGADTTGSQYLTPDGMFPNHAPNPEDKDAIRSISEATVHANADLGLIFDTDVDRMSAVFPDGTPVNRDAVIALISAILAPDYPGSTIITDSVTSDRLTVFLETHLGLKHLCYMRGYKNVINKCKELNASGQTSPLAMETSGHGCLKENYYLDDGAYLAVKVVSALSRAAKRGENITDLISALSDVYAADEMRIPITAPDFVETGSRVLASFRNHMDQRGFRLPSSFEGVRVSFSNASLAPGFSGGWLLLRTSLHDPVMVLNMEGQTEKDLDLIRQTALSALKEEAGIALPN